MGKNGGLSPGKTNKTRDPFGFPSQEDQKDYKAKRNGAREGEQLEGTDGSGRNWVAVGGGGYCSGALPG